MSVVTAGGDDVADVGAFTTSDLCPLTRVEVAVGEAGGLDRVVDGVDVVVGGGDYRRRLAAEVVVVDPCGGDAVEVFVEGAGDDPVVGLVVVEGVGVTACSSSDAVASHRCVNRCTRSRRSARAEAHSSANGPPRPTACSWPGVSHQHHPQ